MDSKNNQEQPSLSLLSMGHFSIKKVLSNIKDFYIILVALCVQFQAVETQEK